MTKIDRYDVEDRITTIDDERKRALDLYSLRLPVPSVGIFDEPTRCYKINKEWAAIVMGMVSWLTEIAPWYQAENEDYEPIQQISLFLGGSDCVNFALRQKPEDSCILQQTLDGETWTDVFDFSLCQSIVDGASQSSIINNFYNTSFQTFQNNVYNNYVTNYAGDITNIHPELGYGDSDDDFRNNALCYSLGRLIDAICDSANEFFNNQAEVGNDLKNSLAIAAAIIGIIALAASGVGTPAAIVLATQAGLWAAGIGIASALGTALYDHWIDTNQSAYNDDAAKEELLCCLYDAMRDSNPDHASLIAAFSCGGLSENAQAIHDAGAILVQELAMYAAFAENMAIGFQSAKLGLLPSCPCDPVVWCKRFDFTLGAQNWHPWETDDRPYGQHLGGIGFGCTLDTLEAITANRVYIENTESLTPYTLTNIKIGYIGTAGASPRFIACQGELDGDFVFDHAFPEWSTDGIEHELEFTLDEIIDKPRVYAGSGGTLVADPDSIVITYIELSGTGSNPYGEDNCE